MFIASIIQRVGTVATHAESRRAVAICSLVVWTLVAMPVPASAATYTWSGGTAGTWNTTTSNWNGSTLAWPNVQSPADNATFSTAGANVNVAGTTLYVNTITMGASGTFTGVGSASTLSFSGTGAAITNSASSLNPSLSNLTIDTGAGLTLSGNAANFTFGNGLVLTGTGAVRLFGNSGSGFFGNSLTLAPGNASFGGGFIAAKDATTRRRTATITGTVANAFGTGASSATGYGSQLVYAQGAQTAVNGVVAGLTASNFGAIMMSGSFTSASRDRFTLQSEGILNGSTAQLAQVKRVSAFSASPTQAEGIFASGAALAVTTNNVNMNTALQGMNLGTASDLYFGLGTTFNNANFAITVGANSPWQGFGTDGQESNESQTGSRTLSAGTVTVDTGNGSFDALRFRSFRVNYSAQSAAGGAVVLGAATFVKSGAGNVGAQVMPYSRLDLANAATAAFFDRFTVGTYSWLYSSQSNAINGKNVSLAAGSLGVLPAANATVTDSVGALTFADGSYIFMPTVTGGTATLTVNDLSRTDQAGLAITGASLSGAQKVYIPGSLQRGKMVVPYIVGNGVGDQDLPSSNVAAASDFLLIDGTSTNLGLIRYGTQSISYDTSWAQGNVVLASTGNANTLITGTVSVDSFKAANSLTGTLSPQINLGVLANGSRAAQAGISSAANTVTIAPAIDLDTAEFVVWNDMDASRTLTFNGAVRTTGGLSKNGRAIAILAGAANAITGAVAVNQGTLRISGGNGLGDSATLNVAGFGTFDLSGASDQVALLTGSGAVALGSTRTLTVSGTGSGTFAGVISGSGSLAKGGAGALTLSGSNTFTGGVQVNGGNLAVGSADALGTAGTISFGGGTLQFTSANSTDYSARFSSAAGQAFSFDTNGQSVTFATGLTSSGGSLTKAGAGTLRLNGAGAYAGTTTVNGGTLVAGNVGAFGSGTVVVGSGAAIDLNSLAVTNAITNNGGGLLNAASYAGTQTLAGASLLTGTVGGALNVASGGVLKGNGTRFSGPVVIQNGATHAPGSSPGLQTFDGGLTYEAGSTLQWELIGNTATGAGTAFDQVLVTGGNLSIATSGQQPLLSLVFNGAGSAVDWSDSFWDVARTWTVVDYSGIGTSNGVFALEGSAATWLDSLGVSLAAARSGNANFSVSATGGDVVLSYVIVPEPAAVSLACFGVAILGFRLLRRRRTATPPA